VIGLGLWWTVLRRQVRIPEAKEELTSLGMLLNPKQGVAVRLEEAKLILVFMLLCRDKGAMHN
jgi:hypothetical protein